MDLLIEMLIVGKHLNEAWTNRVHVSGSFFLAARVDEVWGRQVFSYCDKTNRKPDLGFFFFFLNIDEFFCSRSNIYLSENTFLLCCWYFDVLSGPSLQLRLSLHAVCLFSKTEFTSTESNSSGSVYTNTTRTPSVNVWQPHHRRLLPLDSWMNLPLYLRNPQSCFINCEAGNWWCVESFSFKFISCHFSYIFL